MENWNALKEEVQLSQIAEASYHRPQLIFKHSTRCGISFHAKDRLASATDIMREAVDLYYLDLISYRPVSMRTAEMLAVPHQSPQVILLKAGKVVHASSHFSIDPDRILGALGEMEEGVN